MLRLDGLRLVLQLLQLGEHFHKLGLRRAVQRFELLQHFGGGAFAVAGEGGQSLKNGGGIGRGGSRGPTRWRFGLQWGGLARIPTRWRFGVFIWLFDGAVRFR